MRLILRERTDLPEWDKLSAQSLSIRTVEGKREGNRPDMAYYYRNIAHIWLIWLASRTSLLPFVCIFEHPPLRR